MLKNTLLAGALAAMLAGIGQARAGSAAEFACMRDGPMSQACELAAMEREQANERRAEQQQRARDAQRCLYTRC